MKCLDGTPCPEPETFHCNKTWRLCADTPDNRSFLRGERPETSTPNPSHVEPRGWPAFPNKRRTARALMLAHEEADKARAMDEVVYAVKERRDYWIREARNEGTSLRKIAELTGLSHTAVAKIVARDLHK